MYFVGDLVKVKDRKDISHHYAIGWAEEMNEFCGNIYEVINVDTNRGYPVYNLAFCCASKRYINGNGYWIFVDDWLELVDNKSFEITDNEFEKVFECSV